MKYTAEEVRDYADACRLAHKGPVIADMLTELAERIKVDESAAPVGFVMEATATRHKFGLLTQDLPPGAELFTHPPAQAAQSVDIEAIRKVIEVRDWLLARAQDGQMQRSVYTSNYQLREMAEAINVFADKLEAAIKGVA